MLGSLALGALPPRASADDGQRPVSEEAAAPAAADAVADTGVITVPPLPDRYTLSLKLDYETVPLAPGEVAAPRRELTVQCRYDTEEATGPLEVRYAHANGTPTSTLAIPWGLWVRAEGRTVASRLVAPREPVPATVELPLRPGLVVESATAGLDPSGAAHRIVLPDDTPVLRTWDALQGAKAQARRRTLAAVVGLSAGAALAGAGGLLFATSQENRRTGQTTDNEAEYEAAVATVPRQVAGSLALWGGAAAGVGGGLTLWFGPRKKAQAGVAEAQARHDAARAAGIRLADHQQGAP